MVLLSLGFGSQQEDRLLQKQRQQKKKGGKNDSRGGARRGAEVQEKRGKGRSGWVREAPPGPRCYISSPLSSTGQRGWRAKRNAGRGAKGRGGGGERSFNNLWWEEMACGRGNAPNDDNKENDVEAEAQTECSLRINTRVVKVHKKD